MLGTVLADMGDGLVEASDHFDIQIQRQILIVVLLRLHRLDVCRAVLQYRQGGGVSMQHHAAFRHLLAQGWQETVGDMLIHQQGFYRVTGAWALNFGIDDNLQRFSYIGRIINIDMTHANPAGDHRDRGLLAAQLVQTGAAAWDQHIDVLIHLQHLANQRAIRILNRLDRRGRQPALLQRPLNHFHRGGIGAPGLFPAAQNRGIAGFQAQGSNIDGDVRTGFINHPHHAQRHAAAFDAQTAVQQTAVDHLANRIGQIAHLANIVRNAA